VVHLRTWRYLRDVWVGKAVDFRVLQYGNGNGQGQRGQSGVYLVAVLSIDNDLSKSFGEMFQISYQVSYVSRKNIVKPHMCTTCHNSTKICGCASALTRR
jgi:hypothetical protein